MKVALVALHFAEYALSLARALAEENEVLLILHGPNFKNEVGNPELCKDLPNLKVELLSHSRSVKVLLANSFKIWWLLSGFKPDVIHVQEEPKDYLILALALMRRPMVLTVHDPKPHYGADTKSHVGTRREYFTNYLRRRAAAIIVHGEKLKSVAEESISSHVGRVYSIHHGPLGKLFGVKRNLDWVEGNCLFFGRIEAYKGLGVFIKAITLLRQDGVNVRGVIAGRGSEIERYQADLDDKTIFEVRDRYLSVDEVLNVFQEANVVVLPYLEATQSGVTAYAVGLGRPVVATRVGGLPESVMDGVTGLLVGPNEPAELAEAIKAIVQDRHLADKMAGASYEWGESGMSWKAIARETVKVYRVVAH